MTDFAERLAQHEAKMDEIERLAGQQAYPRTKIRVGAVLFKADVTEWDDGSTSISIEEWVVRSIQRKRGTQTAMGKRRIGREYGDTAPRYVNVTAKVKDITWVRQSRKVNDFGWSKSIPSYYREQFEVGRRLPRGIFTTQLAALKWALKDYENRLARCIKYRDEETDETELAEWAEEIAHREKTIRLLKGRVNKLSNKKSKR